MSFVSQLLGTLSGAAVAFAGGFVIYGLIKRVSGLRLSEEDEYEGADLAIHRINAIPVYTAARQVTTASSRQVRAGENSSPVDAQADQGELRPSV